MQRSLLASSMLVALMCAPQPAAAADIATIPSEPPVYVEPAPVLVPAPVVVAPATTGCWRYGAHGWGWYPCWAGPPAYWHTYRGLRPHWARQHWLFYR